MSESAVSDRLAVVQRGRRLEYLTVGWNAIEGMVAVAGWQSSIGRQRGHDGHQSIVEFLAKLPRLAGSFAPVVALELVGILNRPHSACPAESRARRL